MPISFKNSPIVELIAEVKWGVSSQMIPGAPMGIVTNTAECEDFFMRFGGPAFAAGYVQAERLVPHGFPLMAHQPALRFRQNGARGLLLQIGPGILTVNATPPYKTWTDFEPEIRKGLEALFVARSESENGRPFTGLSLRYLDAFNDSLTGRRDIATFMKAVLGIEVLLPEAITRNAALNAVIKSGVQVQVPMLNERMLSLAVGEGVTNNEPSYVMDTTVFARRPIEPEIEILMTEFAASRAVIHSMFFDLTAPIADLMQPEGEE